MWRILEFFSIDVFRIFFNFFAMEYLNFKQNLKHLKKYHTYTNNATTETEVPGEEYTITLENNFYTKYEYKTRTTTKV